MVTSGVINLKGLLEKRGLSLYRLCQDTGLSYQQGFAIANNRTTKIEFQTLETICNYLSCNVSELIHIRPRSKEASFRSIVLEFPLTNNVKRHASRENGPKPFLQWVGGKRSLIPQYTHFFPKKFNRYIEPFLGGGAIFFHMQTTEAILSDSNPELISTYKAIKENPYEVIELLKLLRARHSPELYQAIRNLDRDSDQFKITRPAEIAARMIYLNQTCFNGVYRVNRHGQFNVPIGSSLNRVIVDESAILKASEKLRLSKLVCADFNHTVEMAEKGDYIYLDPPYFPVSKYSDFTRYTREKFYQQDQERLKQAFDHLNSKGCKVMLSNSDCPYIRDLYEEYNIHTVQAGRNLNVDPSKRGKVSEVVVTNY